MPGQLVCRIHGIHINGWYAESAHGVRLFGRCYKKFKQCVAYEEHFGFSRYCLRQMHGWNFAMRWRWSVSGKQNAAVRRLFEITCVLISAIYLLLWSTGDAVIQPEGLRANVFVDMNIDIGAEKGHGHLQYYRCPWKGPYGWLMLGMCTFKKGRPVLECLLDHGISFCIDTFLILIYSRWKI